MSKEKYLTLLVSLKAPNGMIVGCNVAIRDGYAITIFSDPTLAKKLYEIELKQGADVVYNKKHNAIIQKYPNKTKEEIKDILQIELKKQGAEEVKVQKPQTT